MKHLLLFLLIANTLWAETASAQATGRQGVFGRYQQLVWNERDGLPQALCRPASQMRATLTSVGPGAG